MILFTHLTIISTISIKGTEKLFFSLSIIICVHCWDKWFYVWPNNIQHEQYLFCMDHNSRVHQERKREREREKERGRKWILPLVNTGKLIVATQQLIGRGCQFCLHPQTTLSSSPVLIITLKLFPWKIIVTLTSKLGNLNSPR